MGVHLRNEAREKIRTTKKAALSAASVGR